MIGKRVNDDTVSIHVHMYQWQYQYISLYTGKSGGEGEDVEKIPDKHTKDSFETVFVI